jgi:hypothetical protein
MIDSPTLTSATVANYATLNPNLRQTGTGQAPTSANLKLTANTTGYDQVCCATIASTSGKFYWEVAVNGGLGNFGIADSNNSSFTSIVCTTSSVTSNPSVFTWGWSISLQTGNIRNNNTSTSYGSGASSGDVYMCAVDIDNGKVYWGKNGTWFASGNPASGTNAAFTNVSGNIIPYFSSTDAGGWTQDVNFGQRPFAYTPPTGFVRLNTYNLPDSTIKKGNSYMDAILYTGNGTNGRAITTGMATDFVWVKKRSASDNHDLQDRVRGAAKRLSSNATAAETAISAVASFTSTGFTVDGWGTTNENGFTYVAWSWLANGSGSTNTAGSITSTVSANTTAGFSIVTYAGTNAAATVGHGLGVAPSMIIVKSRTLGTGNWCVYHKSLGALGAVFLNLTNAYATNANIWNNTAPTSTVFSLAGSDANNGNCVAYCWAEIAGFSKFGSYTGNGSTDGPFVYTGFRPKFVMWKRTDTTSNWYIEDSYREAYNSATSPNELYPNLSNAEATNGSPIFLSNGFKLTSTGAGYNASGGTYIYMAFAESPFKSSLAR